MLNGTVDKNRSFQRCSSQAVSWLSSEKTKPNTIQANYTGT